MDRAIDAARAAGVVLQVGFNRRFAADWRAARALLDDGTLGTPRLRALGDPRPRRFRSVPRRAGHDLQRDPDPRLRRAAVPEPRRRGGRGVRHRGRAGGAGLARPRPARHRAGRREVRQRRHRRGRGVLRGHVRLRRARRGVRLGRHGDDGRRPPHRHGVLRRRRAAGRHRAQRPGAAARRLRRRARGVRRRGARGMPGAGHGRGCAGRAGDRPGRGRVRARRAPGAGRRRWRNELPVGGLRRDGVRRPALRGAGPPDRRRRLRGRDLGLDEEGRRRAGRAPAPRSRR